jgi:hypothetical protein
VDLLILDQFLTNLYEKTLAGVAPYRGGFESWILIIPSVKPPFLIWSQATVTGKSKRRGPALPGLMKRTPSRFSLKGR